MAYPDGTPTFKRVPLSGKKPVLFVRQADFKDEYEAAKPYFDIVTQRTEIPPGRKVVGRYSVLPFYKELCVDVRNQRGRLINNSLQHNYVADLKEWVADLDELTPTTWASLSAIPAHIDGPFVLKGATNSRKERWSTHMFAKDRHAAVQVLLKLQEDGLTGPQGVYIRKYEPLVTYLHGIGGQPITREFRFFVAFGEILAGGYYWSSHEDEVKEILGAVPSPYDVPSEFLHQAIERIGDKCNFYALDVAQKDDGTWIVVELNDGQMSGLSLVDPDKLYANLASTCYYREFA